MAATQEMVRGCRAPGQRPSSGPETCGGLGGSCHAQKAQATGLLGHWPWGVLEGAGGRTRLWVYVSPRHTQRSRASCRVRRPGSSTPEAPPSPRFSTVPAVAPPGRRVIRFKGWKEIRRPLQSCPCTSSLALCPLSLRHPPSCWGDTPAAQTTGTGGPLACTGRLVPQGLTTALHFGGR